MNQSAHDLYDEGNSKIAVGDIEAAAEFYRKSIEVDKGFFDGWHLSLIHI